jgi:hypothetical protein
MILSIILSIFSVTFTLSSTTEVKPSGVLPDSTTYRYERTATRGQRGQMTEGNSTYLELNGWDGYVIRAVELQMRSNKSSGKGLLNMTVGDDVVWSIEDHNFCDDAWAGMYTTNWVPIYKKINVLVNKEPIEICISATENSLYIQSYTIYYEKAYHTATPDLPSIPSVPLEAKAYTVYFNSGCDTSPLPITQSSPNTPIILPEWQDTLSWFFIGWSESEVIDNKLNTPILLPGQNYMPTRNTKLWAVYSDVKNNVATTDYISGKYVIARYNDFTVEIGGSGLASYGKIDVDRLHLNVLEMSKVDNENYCMESSYDSTMIYQLVFNSHDSTVYITHFETGEPIGYKESCLSAIDTAWKYRVLGDNSIIFYYTYADKDYVFYFGKKDGKECAFSFHTSSLKIWSENGFWLFPIVERHITSWPLGILNAVEDLDKPIVPMDATYQFGIYELHIHNGKKSLIIR